MRFLRVKKRDLPIPLVVEDDNGEMVVLSLEPAGKEKLGARIGSAASWVVQKVRSLLRRG